MSDLTPASTAEETPINELMSRDPLLLTKQDRSRLVQRFREGRAQFMSQGSRAAPAAKPDKAPKAKKEKVTIDLADLDL
jgi:hypothetical protein